MNLAQRIQNFGTTIFQEMTQLANAHNAINLGQGFPDFPAPDFIKEAAREAIANEINQYAPGNGRSRLRQALAQKYQSQYGLTFNPDTDIVITVGATEAIFAAILGLVDPGDEVILIEPYYDSYVPSVIMAGGVPRFLTLRPPHWHIDPDELETLFNDKTKLILINTPHNPIGKVYSREELEMVARLCQKYDVLVVTDEVYEHLVYDRLVHIPLATLPSMLERTITISSMGKTFSTTGWKVGWAVAPADLVTAVFRGHQFITYSGAAPLQEASAIALEYAAQSNYYTDFLVMYQNKRDLLLNSLHQAGLQPLTPQGTYFTMAKIDALDFTDDVTFCRYLTTEIGVAAIPPSAFYHDPADGAGLTRFAFCKSDDVLVEAGKRLLNLRL
jgi:aspartate/methionine/tyrosine aminotransferase